MRQGVKGYLFTVCLALALMACGAKPKRPKLQGNRKRPCRFWRNKPRTTAMTPFWWIPEAGWERCWRRCDHLPPLGGRKAGMYTSD